MKSASRNYAKVVIPAAAKMASNWLPGAAYRGERGEAAGAIAEGVARQAVPAARIAHP